MQHPKGVEQGRHLQPWYMRAEPNFPAARSWEPPQRPVVDKDDRNADQKRVRMRWTTEAERGVLEVAFDLAKQSVRLDQPVSRPISLICHVLRPMLSRVTPEVIRNRIKRSLLGHHVTKIFIKEKGSQRYWVAQDELEKLEKWMAVKGRVLPVMQVAHLFAPTHNDSSNDDQPKPQSTGSSATIHKLKLDQRAIQRATQPDGMPEGRLGCEMNDDEEQMHLEDGRADSEGGQQMTLRLENGYAQSAAAYARMPAPDAPPRMAGPTPPTYDSFDPSADGRGVDRLAMRRNMPGMLSVQLPDSNEPLRPPNSKGAGRTAMGPVSADRASPGTSGMRPASQDTFRPQDLPANHYAVQRPKHSAQSPRRPKNHGPLPSPRSVLNYSGIGELLHGGDNRPYPYGAMPPGSPLYSHQHGLVGHAHAQGYGLDGPSSSIDALLNPGQTPRGGRSAAPMGPMGPGGFNGRGGLDGRAGLDGRGGLEAGRGGLEAGRGGLEAARGGFEAARGGGMEGRGGGMEVRGGMEGPARWPP